MQAYTVPTHVDDKDVGIYVHNIGLSIIKLPTALLLFSGLKGQVDNKKPAKSFIIV